MSSRAATAEVDSEVTAHFLEFTQGDTRPNSGHRLREDAGATHHVQSQRTSHGSVVLRTGSYLGMM